MITTSRPAMTREQVRQIDEIAMRDYSMPGIMLMENAGHGAANFINQQSSPAKATILCGGGNNGGDGYVIGRHLQTLGWTVEIVSMASENRLFGDAKTNFIIAKKALIPIKINPDPDSLRSTLRDSEVIIDALLGTGSAGPPRGTYRDAIKFANQQRSVKYAVDIPSGLDCDTGIAHDLTFRANYTITFVAEKIGFNKNNADDFVGVVKVIDIGVPKKLLDDFLVR